MVIKKDSPLRRIPSGWDRKQTLYYDAIRCSIEMADMAYTRLRETLLGLTVQRQSQGKIDNLGLKITSAMLDAWSIIDSVHRLRGLLRQTPGLEHSPRYTLFVEKKTQDVETLRHTIQHLDQEINNIVSKDLAVLGALSWVAKLKPSDKWCYTCTIVAGTLFERTDPMIDPAGKKIALPIDLITLDAETSVVLSDLMIEVVKLTSWLEQELKNLFGDLPQAGADVFYSAECHFRQ